MTTAPITIRPPIICKGASHSPKNTAAIIPADIGSRVAVILAGVGWILSLIHI